jgi:protein involved in temperature-dependent protein secretion
VKLGRMTDWRELGAGLYSPSGLRLFLVDDSDRAVFEVRNLEFDHVANQSRSAPA